MTSRSEIGNFGPNLLGKNSPNTPTMNTSEPSISSSAFPEQGSIFIPRKTPERAPKKPADKIEAWFGKIEKVNSDNKNYQNLVENMKQFLYESYVIKPEDIPQSHWNLQGETAIRDGRKQELINDGVSIEEKTIQNKDGTSTTKREFTFPQDLKEQEISLVISNQKQSLDAWIKYLTLNDAMHPMWARIWALKALRKIGKFEIQEEGKAKFTDRVKKTVAPFPTLNALALANAISEMHDILEEQSKGKKTQQSDQNEDEMFQQNKASQRLLSRDRFSKLYAKQLDEASKYSTEGLEKTQIELKKYPQGSGLQSLVDSLKGHPLEWCIANLETAKSYLEKGDIDIFYSYSDDDKPGQPSIPRLAIAMEGSGKTARIVEVRGIGPEQELDKYIAPFIGDILERNYGEKAKEYQKKAADMRHLTELEKKQNNNEDFSKEDLLFLYEIYEHIEGFGYGEDPRSQEIIKKRNTKEDLAFALGTTEDRISLTKEEALSGNILCHYGDLYFYPDSGEEIMFPEIVLGILYLSELRSLERVTLPKKVVGDLFIPKVTSLPQEFMLPEVGKGLYLYDLTSCKKVIFPKKVGGDLNLQDLASLKEVTFPETVVGDLRLNNLTSLEGTTLPEKVGGDLNLKSLTLPKGVTLPEVGGSLYLFSLTSVKELTLPENFRGNLCLGKEHFDEANAEIIELKRKYRELTIEFL